MENILKKVDIERLYQHILKTEGIKHPIVNPEKLNETADYIKSEFERYGLRTNEQEFKVDDFDFTFKNIEGILGDSSEPELLITSHYDTVRNAPGANDNGSAIAAMLESARILAEEREVSNIRFVSFTLEELHPGRAEKTRNYALELGIYDENYRYKTYHIHKMLKKFFFGVNKRIAKRKPVKDSWEEAFSEIEKNLTDSEKKYFTFLKDLNEDITQTSWIGKLGLVGSDYWVKKAQEEKKEILGVINLETIGYTSKRKHSQLLPPLMHPLIFPSYKVKARKLVGNFISVVSDK
ncbi:MAG: M28 family peptidase, partial [Candidatus Heimdallarchaeota archaeon]|nr:M28 family peptidase [Candidatus Heimdallarchaeota archaeon]